jgi:hypothetical protein
MLSITLIPLNIGVISAAADSSVETRESFALTNTLPTGTNIPEVRDTHRAPSR